MNFVIALVVSVIVYIGLGRYWPVTDHTALLITFLGGFGALSYKFLAACSGFSFIYNRLK